MASNKKFSRDERRSDLDRTDIVIDPESFKKISTLLDKGQIGKPEAIKRLLSHPKRWSS